MRISVVIATFNRASLLRESLDHLSRQQYEAGDEVIVVDNASTDLTPEVIARAAADFPVPLRRLRETTPGKTPALNAGLAAANGDVLALTDDDVLVADDWISTIRRIFEDASLALAGGRVDPRWERPAPSWLRVEQDGHYGPMASPLALLHYGAAQPLAHRTAVGANLVVRRDVLQALQGFAPHLGRQRGTLLCGEDHDFCQRAVAAGYACEYRPELRVRHWVPADRVRLSYYIRWFFWSGVTDAVLKTDHAHGGAAPFRHLLRRVLSSAPAALAHLAAGRPSASAARLMDGAFACGYFVQSLRRARRDLLRTSRPNAAVGARG
jgi:glycosyltransferase involved in cell wall biosynthesis